jgi:hypothetical protein
MKILCNDVIQKSNAQNTLKSPALSDITTLSKEIVITLDKQRTINAIGIGNYSGATLSIAINGTTINISYSGSGLYLLSKSYTTNAITIKATVGTIGRFGAGL